MERSAFLQFAALERDHWWFRGRRAVYLGLLDSHLEGRAAGARLARALDLGCGPGGFLEGLAERSAFVVGTDPDLASLARSRATDTAPRVASLAGALPFRDGAFELVCLFDVLEHLDDEQSALREARRVLAPGGTLALSVPAYPWLFSNNDRVAMHRRRYTRRSLRAVVEAAGFEVVRNTHANVLLAPWIVPIVLATRALESLSGRGGSTARTNLSWPLPRPLHGLLARVFAAELALTRRVDAPFGHSIALLAKKPLADAAR